MTRLPVISPRKMCRVLESLGFELVRQICENLCHRRIAIPAKVRTLNSHGGCVIIGTIHHRGKK